MPRLIPALLLSAATVLAAPVWASGSFGGNVSNNGRFLSGANMPASIAGNFSGVLAPSRFFARYMALNWIGCRNGST